MLFCLKIVSTKAQKRIGRCIFFTDIRLESNKSILYKTYQQGYISIYSTSVENLKKSSLTFFRIPALWSVCHEQRFNANRSLDRYCAICYREYNFLISFIFLLASYLSLVLDIVHYDFELSVCRFLYNRIKSVEKVMTFWRLGETKKAPTPRWSRCQVRRERGEIIDPFPSQP